jgi:uncharacterized BrkB/YihY/UPF0761 family membrane protein
MLADDFPGSADFLRTNIEALIELRGAVGMASVVALLWLYFSSRVLLFGAELIVVRREGQASGDAVTNAS